MSDVPNNKLKVTLSDATPIICECGSPNFMQLARFFKFSALLTGSPKDSIMPIDVFVCGQCGKTLQEMLPGELRDKPKINLSNIEIES